jgi:WD40 repeat protein
LPGDIGEAEVAFSPDGKWLVVGTVAEYQFWDTSADAAAWQLHHRVAREYGSSLPGLIGFSRDSRMVAVAHSNFVVRLLSPGSGETLATLTAPDLNYLSWLCFSRDGSKLVAACESNVIQVWDLSLIRQRLDDLGIAHSLPHLPPPEGPSARPGRRRLPAVTIEFGVLEPKPLPDVFAPNQPPATSQAVRE